MDKLLVNVDPKNALKGELVEAGEHTYRVGGLVTRTGLDIHKVVEVNLTGTFECIYDNGDFYEVGEVETNILSRYDKITKQDYPDLYRVARLRGWIKK